MINAPQGMATGLPAAHGTSCAVTQAPATLVGGGPVPSAAAGVALPTLPPVPTIGGAAGAPTVPASAATGAVLGATTIGGGLPAAATPSAPAPTAPVAPGAPATPAPLDASTVLAAALPAITTALAAISGSTIGGGTPAAATGAPGAPGAGLPTLLPAPVPSVTTPGPLFAATPSSSISGPSSVIAAVTGGASAPPAAAPAPAAATGALPGAVPATAAATRPLTTLAPGGSPQDAALVERALNVLRQSPSGAQVVDRLLAVGARVNVISDEEFRAMGHGEAHAFYDPKIDTMFLRRSDLADDQNVRFAAVALAHEGTHLLDDVARLSEPFISDVTNRVAAAGGLGTQQGAAIRDQAMFELTMIKETRAFLFAGSIARELGMQLPANDPTSTAIAGGNDQATYDAVWNRLLRSSYNPEGRSAAPRNL